MICIFLFSCYEVVDETGKILHGRYGSLLWIVVHDILWPEIAFSAVRFGLLHNILLQDHMYTEIDLDMIHQMIFLVSHT